MTAYTPGNPFAPKASAEPTPAPAPEPVDAPEVDQPTRPVGDALDDARTLTARLVAVLAEARRAAVSTDQLVDVAAAAKASQADVYAEQNASRSYLWTTFGPGKHATETGRPFSFTKPSGSRSCDYAALEKGYPDAYDTCVKRTEPKPDAVGSLRLPKGAAK